MLPIQITTRGIDNSEAVHAKIRERAEKLNRFFDRICSCRVVIEQPQRHKHQGKLFNVRIDLAVPGKELAVTKKQHEDVYVAIRDAFDAVARQLEDHAKKIRGQIKSHPDVMHGHIARLYTDEGYGFIDGMDGNEYYFSVTNVNHTPFDRLHVGDSVEYWAETSNDGCHAEHVVKERHHKHSVGESPWL